MPVGTLKKMLTSLVDGKAQYQLKVGSDLISLNDKLGQNLSLSFQNVIYCANCGNPTKKSYAQGYCYLCSQRLASCDMCILKPETCHYHQGTCRQPEWGLANCFKQHTVYLANSSGAKVGITRHIPQRFIDQGAVSALPMLKVDNRLKSGKLEMQLKQYINDKTNWRKMLIGEAEKLDLVAIRNRLLPKINLVDAITIPTKIINISYPVLEYPQKITSLSFDKTQHIDGMLLGIKGQYLILDTGVLNVRRFSSYLVDVSISEPA